MLLPRSLLAATTAVSLAGFLSLASPAQAASCGEPADFTVLPSPVAPWKGAPLRVMVVAQKPVNGGFSLVAPDGTVAATTSDRKGGEPYFWFAEVATPAAGTWHAKLQLDAGCDPI